MTCGKGGYVRSLARDLGAELGCLGHVQALRRLWSGPFTLAAAVDLATLAAEAGTPALEARLLPVRAALAGLPELACPDARRGAPAQRQRDAAAGPGLPRRRRHGLGEP